MTVKKYYWKIHWPEGRSIRCDSYEEITEALIDHATTDGDPVGAMTAQIEWIDPQATRRLPATNFILAVDWLDWVANAREIDRVWIDCSREFPIARKIGRKAA